MVSDESRIRKNVSEFNFDFLSSFTNFNGWRLVVNMCATDKQPWDDQQDKVEGGEEPCSSESWWKPDPELLFPPPEPLSNQDVK
jgi:hypothetical protein